MSSYDDADEERERLAALWKPQHAGVAAGGLKAHRHIYIDWPKASIKKTLAIGASAPDASPPIYDRPRVQDEEENAASCVLVTKSSPIQATVHIVKEPKAQSATTDSSKTKQKPILVSAKTGSVGSISLTIPTYHGARPLNIRAKSYSGNITIYLPTSFSGLLTWTSETGTLKVSKTMQHRFKSLDNPPHKHRGTAKIAPSTASGLRGDVCTISNHHGSITIREYDDGSSAIASGERGDIDKSCVVQ
ncbi:hypothetical protein EX895_004950 [Sporisorium graminicola]|uniref:DUF7330 domain-containing protein n=1 Tax=Sporisorium graminicola TaxID=280036 RepID=A0A4U7KNR9_9BASI|nr:hypothetical protein EX895_004950 [Sporisorium graminicola]TKY86125.1 hypothetical protein EX895_004950 [Sporisorium graminicola]